MADYTNFPELTDEMLQKFIGHALQQATKEDTRSPLSSGLLTAGLAMMAGSRGRNFGEALGQGGLLGLQAYGAQKELAKKDPAQMIALLNSIEDLKANRDMSQLFKGLGPQVSGAPQFQPAPGEPADIQQRGYGMFSRDDISPSPNAVTGKVLPPEQQTGFMGSMVTPPPTFTGNVPPVEKLYPLLARPKTSAAAQNLAEILGYKPQNVAPGNTLMVGGKPTYTSPNIGPNMEMTPQGVRPYTGVTQSLADIAAATTTATEAAKAGQDVIEVTEGGRKRNVNRAQWLAEQQQKPGVPADIQTLWADYLKSGGAERGEPFKLNYIPKPQQAALNPTAVETAVETKKGEAPVAIQQSAQTGANTDFITNEFRPTMVQGQQAIKSIAGLDVLDSLPNTPTGWGTTARVYGARVLEGMGFPSDKAKDLATNATIFNKTVQAEVNRKLMEAKGVQTEGDAQRAAMLYSQMTDPNAANQFTRDMARAQHNQEMAKAKLYSSGYSDAIKGGDPYVLEAKWREQQKSIFDDPAMKKWAIKEAPAKEKSGDMVQTGAPPPGAVVDGFQFKGGNPNDKKNWVKQ